MIPRHRNNGAWGSPITAAKGSHHTHEPEPDPTHLDVTCLCGRKTASIPRERVGVDAPECFTCDWNRVIRDSLEEGMTFTEASQRFGWSRTSIKNAWNRDIEAGLATAPAAS